MTTDTAVRGAAVRWWRRPWSRRLGAGIVVAVALSMGVIALLEPAPTALSALAPADGAGLAAAPTEVAMEFTAPPRTREYHLTVATARGIPVTEGTARVDGSRITVPVRIADRGVYLVGYHVLLEDGTEATGISRFSVGEAAAPAPIGEPLAAPAGHGGHGAKDPLSLVLVSIDVVLLVALSTLLFRRPRPRRPTG
ncbi:copper resistance protein CopC [Longispora sp. NPDC051575]|uniref:copper resistance protein CopC n=1 Tax=Longispora sp. NPDC051575 TaxID=3154943 RepID=UPI0034363D89